MAGKITRGPTRKMLASRSRFAVAFEAIQRKTFPPQPKINLMNVIITMYLLYSFFLTVFISRDKYDKSMHSSLNKSVLGTRILINRFALSVVFV